MAPLLLHLRDELIENNIMPRKLEEIFEEYLQTAAVILNQCKVAMMEGTKILQEFQDMMSEQSALEAEGADEYTKYFELVWANLGCGLTSVTGFCTAINPIDFTLWTIEIFLLGLIIGIMTAQFYNCARSSACSKQTDK